MIRYNLNCAKGHGFESWFSNSDAFDMQAKRGLVECPTCGSTKVEKALMAPTLGRGAKKKSSSRQVPAEPIAAETTAPAPVAMVSPVEQEFRAKLKELKEHLTKNSDYVGPKFSEEARKMHYGETEHRSIYGVASPEDARELAEEGIEFLPVPILPDERN